jgi:tRNA(Ile)-lysidine synthase
LRQALKAQSILDPVAAARSAQCLADADAALDWAADQAIAGWEEAADMRIIRDRDYPAEIFRRIVMQRVQANDPRPGLRGHTLDGIIAAMQTGRRAMVGELLIDAKSDDQGRFWRISQAPRRKARTIG